MSSRRDLEAQLHAWWRELSEHQRRTLMRLAHRPLPADLVVDITRRETRTDLVICESYGSDAQWYLSRDAARYVEGHARGFHAVPAATGVRR